MRPIVQLMAELREAKVRIWAEGEQLGYQAPRGMLTPELLAELRDRKAELIEFCRQAQAENEAFPLEPVPRDGDLPISLAQQRLWVLDQLEGPNPTYNIPLALRLRGELDVDALKESFSALIRRHESLRTAFEARDGEVRAVIALAVGLPWSQLNLRHLPTEFRLAEVRKRAREEALHPFDLGRAPLIRFVLWQLDRGDHVLMMNVHHIVADGRSIEILADEMAALYEGHCRGRAVGLPELRVHYADFAWHQRRWLVGSSWQGQIDYWTKQLAGLPPLLELPADRPRPPVFTAAGASLRRALDSGLVDRLRQFARQSGVSLNTVLLAGAALLLARYTGRDDIPIACPATHRNRPELERLVGFFINTLVLRFDVSGAPSFRELLRRTRAMVADAFANQDVPFDKLVETLRPERTPSYPPLAQVSVAMLDGEKTRLRLAGLETAPFEFGNPIARYDLTLELYESAGLIDVYWMYNTGLFDEATVRRMAGHLNNLLAAAIAEPDRAVTRLPLLDAAEFRQVIHGWNDTTVAEPPGRPLVHRVFEGWAERAPEAAALALDGRILCYRELNARANRLAHRLMEAGVGPDQPVGVCFERSSELVVAVLAVLKAGGAYVPLDPAYPGERLAFMLRDADARLLLTDSSLLARLPDGRPAAICLDADREFLADASTDNPDAAIADENLAYVIYTSGSTGRPKGCLIEHRNLMHYLGWAGRHYYPDGQGGSFGLFTSLAFDLTVTALFLPLIRGRTLRIFAPDAALDSILREYFAPDSMLDSVKLTPAHVSLLPSLDLPATRVRVAVVGGEQLLIEQVKALWRLNPRMRIYNEYGPTEATVGCVVKEILPDENRILIGRPIDNMCAYVLDEHLQPLPVGVPGQLYLGGKGLACGYLNRPELTAEKFIPDPYSARAGARLYWSGDLARWLPSGDLECLGRTDHQVKIRGFRIELGEVEAVLGEHPAVRQAAVLVADDAGRGKRLVAYVAGRDLPAPAELRDYLHEHLPDYMVPAVLVALDALPLTINGKIDREALPPLQTAGAEPAAVAAPPRTETERVLAGIWSQLLGLEQVGIHDNFFELGGDSILSIQVVSRARQAGLRLVTRQFLQHPTIAGLAAAAEFAAPPGTAPSAADAGPIPLTPIQHWFFEQDLAEPHHFNQALLMELAEPLESALLEQCVQQVAAHHDALRLRFRRGETDWCQELAAPGGNVPYVRIDLAALAEAEQGKAIEARAAEAQTQLRLDENLVRVVYFDCGPGRSGRLLWVIHHLAVDGVSWRILLEDLLTAYEQVRHGAPIRLPPRTTAFRHWAARLAEYAGSAALRGEQKLWLVAARAQVARLPVDSAAGPNIRASARQVAVALSPEETRSLLREVPTVYRTQIREVLLAALASAFRDWTGSDALLVDLEGHGREDLFEDIDLSHTVGWLTAMAPVLLDLEGNRDWGLLLRTVKEQLRRIPNGGLGYGVLRYLGRDADVIRELNAQPQAEVCFNYLGQLDQTLLASAPLVPARESPGPYVSPAGHRRYLLEIDGQIEGGCLQFRWQYSVNSHRGETIERVAQGFLKALRALIAHCRCSEAGDVAPSDFPLAGLDQGQLNKVAQLLNAARTK